MRVRLLVIMMLLLVMAATAPAQQQAENDNPPAAQEEQKLTPEEEREALALAARFSARLRSTSDFGQLVDELFVRDFSGRLRQTPQDSLPLYFLDKSLVGRATPDELRRYYVASMNFYELFFRLYEVADQQRKQAGSEEEPQLEEALSPEVIEVLLSNRLAATWIKEELSDEREKENGDNGRPAEGFDSAQAVQTATDADNGKSEQDNEEVIIKSLADLNDTSATFEKAAELLRQRLSYMPMIAPAVDGNSEEDKEKGEEEGERREPKLSSTSLDEGEFGFPKGTPVIHLDVRPYCLTLIKVDGQFKILSANLYVD